MKFTHIGLVAAFAACAPVLVASPKPAAPDQAAQKTEPAGDELAPQIALDELKKIVETKGATIIDVNSLDSYNDGHIPGAVHFGSNEGKLASVLPADKGALLVAYCGGVKCTAWEFAAKEAKLAGYTNIKHFKGGIKGWKDAGLATDKGQAKKSS